MTLLIVMALPSESQGLLEAAGHEVLYSGVGKVNATHALTRRLTQKKFSSVLNLGSAGSSRFKTGELVAAHRFVQRDMDATGLGFKHGETPFDYTPLMLEFTPHFDLPHGICGSGDSFLQGPPPIECDIIDMEAYAFAKVCKLEGMQFACAKYITDGADHTAHNDWQENLQHAAKAFVELLAMSK